VRVPVCTSTCVKMFILSLTINDFHSLLLSILLRNSTLVHNRICFYIVLVSRLTWLFTVCGYHTLCSVFTELSPSLLHCPYCVSVGCSLYETQSSVCCSIHVLTCFARADHILRTELQNIKSGTFS
jgi:hypothetical protein